MSKGSAFVKFETAEQAQSFLAAIKALRGGVLIKDRECRADLAVERDRVKDVIESRELQKPGDKRNLYLANEGLAIPEQHGKHK